MSERMPTLHPRNGGMFLFSLCQPLVLCLIAPVCVWTVLSAFRDVFLFTTTLERREATPACLSICLLPALMYRTTFPLEPPSPPPM